MEVLEKCLCELAIYHKKHEKLFGVHGLTVIILVLKLKPVKYVLLSFWIRAKKFCF